MKRRSKASCCSSSCCSRAAWARCSGRASSTGIFAIGYGVARIVCEFFREPDPQLGFLFGGATMGMLLSLPLIAAGIGFRRACLARAARKLAA